MPGMATACVLNGRLYVIGGHDSNKLQVLEMTDENGLSWSAKPTCLLLVTVQQVSRMRARLWY